MRNMRLMKILVASVQEFISFRITVSVEIQISFMNQTYLPGAFTMQLSFIIGVLLDFQWIADMAE